MSLSRSPSSTTLIVEKRRKISCFSGLRPFINAIRSRLPSRRLPAHSPPTFYTALPSLPPATETPACLFSPPSSPISRPHSPSIQSEASLGWIDAIFEDDNDSLYSVDHSDSAIHLDSSFISSSEISPNDLIIYRPPEPEPAQNYEVEIAAAA
ncbi:hypothetical protein PRIPAC_85504 [Pristionchus pacificus]|uniref:Uncharacterized protein n=1 Tax=Pristionchus pacificus TaxID=54126 RepID=A0A454Y6L4_PRIPA|nr:hypothetical protein PRIPAC_85504 [Pristionchus pacificus]|eukprot:PDM67508.1 hypothetical protein PRIPAC_48925 [Pristionchus pacificus]